MVNDGRHLEKQIEKHIGCMPGFLQIFDPIPGRHRRRRLPPCPTPPSDRGSTCSSPAVSEEFISGKVSEIRSPAPEPEEDVASVKSAPRTPKAAFPVFEFKDGGRLPWKFSKEAPRLSLDSRAVTDANGGLYPRDIRTVNHVGGIKEKGGGGHGDDDAQRRSPSVVARLMGLENLPSSDPNNLHRRMELRRSASDSRANKEIYRFIEGGNYGNAGDYPRQSVMASVAPADWRPVKENGNLITRTNARREPEKSGAIHLQRGSVQRKSYYDTADVFPELNRCVQNGSLSEDIGKKLRARGINEPSKDLESLKQILEAMQLKGLLHCKAGNSIGSLPNQRKGFDPEESPIVLMRPRTFSGRNRSESRSPTRSPITGRVSAFSSIGSRANSPNGRRPPEEQRTRSGTEQGRSLRARSPRAIVARKAALNHSPTHQAYRGSNFPEDDVSTVSESSVSPPSTQTDNEKSKLAKGYKGGRTLLERCDKLLNSIAEITAAAELQPSPVSVLDGASLYDAFEGPRSLKKRGPLHFKDCSPESADEDAWSPEIRSLSDHDRDFAYVSDVVGASNYLPGDPDLFELLEKRWYLQGNDSSSPASRLQRNLTFNCVLEILDRRRRELCFKRAPWTVPELEKADLGKIWSDYRKIRQDESLPTSGDLLESVRRMLGEDVAGNVDDEWEGRPVETTEHAVDIERLVFKDLIGETIRDLASECRDEKPKPGIRRRLGF